jgi:hypothetical protein
MPERLTDAQIDLLRRFVAVAGDNSKADWDALEVVRLHHGSLMHALLAELDATRAERGRLRKWLSGMGWPDYEIDAALAGESASIAPDARTGP